MATRSNWNPLSPLDWARILGLVHVPLFGTQRPTDSPEGAAVLLDGQAGSLALYPHGNVNELLYGDAPLSWSWSANLRHALVLNEPAGQIIHRRWDSPKHAARYPIPGTPIELRQLFDEIERTKTFRVNDVIARMLQAFRQVRRTLSPSVSDRVASVRTFNALLTGVEMVRRNLLDEANWRKARTMGEALLPLALADIQGIPEKVREVPIGELVATFVDPDPSTGCQLYPDLLIRHASGVLYQEAHLEIERDVQPYLPGFAPGEPQRGVLKNDVRFTPPLLARALVQYAFEVSKNVSQGAEVTIFDPACGSGAFLLESVRELVSRKFTGTAKLIGLDSSEVSCAMSRFCLERAVRDFGDTRNSAQVTVTVADALRQPWPEADVILMNPPFVAWNKMDAEERHQVRECLGEVYAGHADKAMAFVWKAVQVLPPGGVLGCVIPSPFLESNSGEKWRAALSKKGELSLMGRFEGYAFFHSAMVEPAFFVFRKHSASRLAIPRVKVILAEEGAEGKALRAARQEIDSPLSGEKLPFEVFEADPDSFTPATWLPRSRRSALLIERLRTANMPCVEELFDVHQGIRTGNNRVFVLTHSELAQLPSSERRFFRPAASSSTIRNARLEESAFVFYPYNKVGGIFTTEDDLQKNVPTYYEQRLARAKESLESRPKIDPSKWWLLTWERQWQWEEKPKFVTASFGDAGSFAYDQVGEFVVLQGYGWLWKWDEAASSEVEPSAGDEFEAEPTIPFHEGRLPWAYLAIFNSEAFETLLRHFCPRVQGGQFNLATQFVKSIFLPDLSDENSVSGDDVRELAELGQAVVRDKPFDYQRLSAATARVYGVPLDQWMIEEGKR
jgi:SAM-dependent methyltransferase